MPPRTLTTGRRSASPPTTVIPEEWKQNLVTLSLRSAGFGLISIAGLSLVALASYSPQDPSWNVAGTTTNFHNFLGPWGARVADISWQLIGWGGTIPPLILATWGWRLYTGAGVNLALWRALAGTLSSVAFAIGCGALASDFSIQSTYAGGGIGKVLGGGLAQLMNDGWWPSFIAFVMGGMSLAAFSMASCLSWAEWRGLFLSIYAGMATIATLTSQSIRWIYERLTSSEDRERPSRFTRSTKDRSAGDDLSPDDSAEDLEEDGEPPEDTDSVDEDESEDETDDPIDDSADVSSDDEDDSDEEPEDDEESQEIEEEGEERPSPLAAIKRTLSKVTPSRKPSPKKTQATRQTSLPLDEAREHELPPLELLQPAPPASNSVKNAAEPSKKNAKLLESVLSDFGVQGTVLKASPGPVVTLYELEPSPGTRAARVISLADDIARNMSAVSVRVAVVPGRNVIGIEMPNAKRETVYLRELLNHSSYEHFKGSLPLVLGKDISGAPVIADLARMPHLLIAGTTGSGKSVAINTMVLSLLYSLPPSKCRFIMIDPKMLELSVYEGIPHLLAPVVTEPKKAIMALRWTVREMEERYRAMSKLGVRNIDGYNARLREAAQNDETLMRTIQTGFDRDTGKPIYEEQPLDLTELPYIVVIVDEMADLMLVAGKEIEAAVQRLAQMARAAGIHIMMATQRPSVDVITGTIKANFPTRISFQVTSKIDSRTILGEQGAEQLLGQGDMLYMAGGGRITRVHGPFVRDDEVEGIVKFLKQQGPPDYLDDVTADDGSGDDGFGDSDGNTGGNTNSGDALYDKAVDIVLRERKASTSFIQRQLQIGYNKAANLVERMEREGLIGPANAVGKREILARDTRGD